MDIAKTGQARGTFSKIIEVLTPAAAAHTETVFISGLELMLNEWMRPWRGFR